MADGWTTILVRYGEIGIKGRTVRARFEKRLVENLERQLAVRHAPARVDREWGRVLVHTTAPDAALDALRHTFGVVSASVARTLPTDLDEISSAVAAESVDVLSEGQSFAVKGRRTGEHPYTSMDVQRHAGAAIMEANRHKNVSVDLTNPDVTFEIEVRPGNAYYFRGRVDGPGGLPEGTQGKVGILLEDARSVLAAWQAMKRGTSAHLLADAPLREELRAPLEALARFRPDLTVQTFPTDRPLESAADRRAFLLAVASAWLPRHGARAVFVGDGVQGHHRLGPLDERCDLPVFRPLVGYVGERLRTLADAATIPDVAEEADEAHAPAAKASLPAGPDREALRDILRQRAPVDVGPRVEARP